MLGGIAAVDVLLSIALVVLGYVLLQSHTQCFFSLISINTICIIPTSHLIRASCDILIKTIAVCRDMSHVESAFCSCRLGVLL